MFGAWINIFIRWQETKQATSVSECFTAEARCWNAVQIQILKLVAILHTENTKFYKLLPLRSSLNCVAVITFKTWS